MYNLDLCYYDIMEEASKWIMMIMAPRAVTTSNQLVSDHYLCVGPVGTA